METDTSAAGLPGGEVVKKAPRKPRPSELAAKAAKAAGKTAPKAAKKTAKTKAKKASKPKAAVKKVVKKAAKKAAKKSSANKPKVRTARLDIRATPAERAKVLAVAKRKKMTITQVVMLGLAKIK